MTLIRDSSCVDGVDEDQVAIVDLGIALLALDSDGVHNPLLHSASCRRLGCPLSHRNLDR